MDARTGFFTAIEYAGQIKGIDLTVKEAARLGARATRRCKELGTAPGRTPDPRFGHVNKYAREILDHAWSSLCNEGSWEPYWRLQDKHLNERWADGEKVIAAAADGLHAWHERYRDLHLGGCWRWLGWPDDGDGGLQEVHEEIENKIAILEGEIEDLRAFKAAVDNAMEAAAGYPEIIDMIERRGRRDD
jgi:hypothetical protein